MYRLTSNNVQPLAPRARRWKGLGSHGTRGRLRPPAPLGARGRTPKRGEFFEVSFSIQTFSGTDLKTPQRDAPRLLNLGSQWQQFLFPVKTDNFRPWREGGKKNALLPLSVNSGFSHYNYICYEARRLCKLYCNCSERIAYTSIGLVWFFFCFFGSLENGSCITLLPLVAFKTAPCHGTHLPSVKPFKMDWKWVKGCRISL